MDTKLYIDFIKETLRTNGIKVADIANKKALEMGQIDTALYSKAARILVEAYLAQ